MYCLHNAFATGCNWSFSSFPKVGNWQLQSSCDWSSPVWFPVFLRSYGLDFKTLQVDESKDSADALNTSNNTKTATISHGDSLGMHLGAGSPKRAVDSANGFGSQTEMLEGQTDVSRAQSDALNMSNKAETVGISHGDGASTYLGAIDEKRSADVADGLASHTDMSSGHTDTQSAHTDTITPADEVGNISTHRNKLKVPNSPAGSATSHSDMTDGFGNRTDMSNAHTDVHNIGNNMKMAVNKARTVRTLQNNLNMQNSPTRAVKHHINEPNGLGHYADTSSMHTDVQSIVENARTPADKAESVKMA